MRPSSKSPGRGKKIDTIFYDVTEVDDQERPITKKVVIDIYFQKKFEGDGENRETVGVWFEAECKSEKITGEGTDLDVVLKYVRSKLDASFKIKWESWLIVTVKPVSTYGDGMGGGLTLTWKSIERGTTRDGEVLMRVYNHHQEWQNRWEIKPWPKEIKENGKVVATIPETKENLAALEAFRENIDEMRKRLAAFVAPDKIQETLSAIIAGNPMLMIGHET